jgi:hypothetical protein
LRKTRLAHAARAADHHAARLAGQEPFDPLHVGMTSDQRYLTHVHF